MNWKHSSYWNGSLFSMPVVMTSCIWGWTGVELFLRRPGQAESSVHLETAGATISNIIWIKTPFKFMTGVIFTVAFNCLISGLKPSFLDLSSRVRCQPRSSSRRKCSTVHLWLDSEYGRAVSSLRRWKRRTYCSLHCFWGISYPISQSHNRGWERPCDNWWVHMLF